MSSPLVLRLGELAHREIAIDAVLAALRGKAVEVGLLRAPEPEALGHRNLEAASSAPLAAGDDLAVRVLHLDLDLGARLLTVHLEAEGNLARVDVGDGVEALDPGLGHGLHPHALPDARDARIEAALRIQRLLAERIDEALGRIPRPDEQVVRPLPHQVGDIVGEAGLRTLVGNAGLDAVHEHLRAEVNAVEAKDQPTAGDGLGVESATVLDHLAGGGKPPDAGKRGLDRERDEDLARGDLAHDALDVVRDDGVVPGAVQTCPAIAHHLRTRILAPRVVSRHLLAKGGHHRRRQYRTQHIELLSVVIYCV